MAIVITKPKQQEQALPVSEFGTRIDEIGKILNDISKLDEEIHQREAKAFEKMAALSTKLKPVFDKLVTDLNEHYKGTEDEELADKTFIEAGKKFQAEIGKKVNSRVVSDMELVKQLLEENDPKLFLKLCKVNLGDLDKYLTPDECDAVMTKSRGKRPVEIKKIA